MPSLRFSLLAGAWVVARLDPDQPVPDSALSARDFLSITRTSEELSVVCREEAVPDDLRAERGWAVLKLEGPFAFTQVGILASFLAPLAAAGIGIFAVSTFDTDYVLVKADQLPRARAALAEAGHEESCE